MVDLFGAYGAAADQATRDALKKAAGAGVKFAHATPTRYAIGEIIGRVTDESPHRTAKGWAVRIVAPDWRSIFFEKGTYTRRRGKLKRPRRSSRSNLGVHAHRFLLRALKETQRTFEPELRRQLP